MRRHAHVPAERMSCVGGFTTETPPRKIRTRAYISTSFRRCFGGNSSLSPADFLTKKQRVANKARERAHREAKAKARTLLHKDSGRNPPPPGAALDMLGLAPTTRVPRPPPMPPSP